MYGINSLAWDPAGERIAASSDEGMRVWCAQTGQLLIDVDGFDYSDLTLSPDGEKFAAIADVETLGVWDTATGELLASTKNFTGIVSSLAWDPSGERLLSASNDDPLTIWDANSLQLLTQWDGHRRKVLSVAWDPGGERFATASNDMTEIGRSRLRSEQNEARRASLRQLIE